MGDDGPFQRFERSEMSQEEFYREFGRRLSDVEANNAAYRKYCKRVGTCRSAFTETTVSGRPNVSPRLQLFRSCPEASRLTGKR